MRTLHPTRPRPWWVHGLFLAVLAAFVLTALLAPSGPDAAPVDNAAEIVGFAIVTVIALAVSLLVDPYAGPLLLAASAVVGTAVGSDAFDDNTFAFIVPVTVCASFYYALHVWVSGRVWELTAGGRRPADDDVRERRALVLEIGRRFLVAWTLLFLLEMVSAVVPAFGDHSQAVLTAVRDAGGVVVIIDVLALAPLRVGEARRVFDEHRLVQRRSVPSATMASGHLRSPIDTWRTPPVAVSAAGLQSARARIRRCSTSPGGVADRSSAAQPQTSSHAEVVVGRHARGEQSWTPSGVL